MPALLCLGLSFVAAAAQVEGRVALHGSGEPVVDTEVSVVRGPSTRTDARGRFVLELEPGRWQVEVDGVQHLPLQAELEVPLPGRLELFVQPIPAPLEIVVEAFRPSAHISRHAVDAEQAYETPGTLDDSVRLVQALPGVTVQREYSPTSGDLSVRGSAPGDNRYYLDGVQIPYLYHFGQYASVYPASNLAEVELFPSTFGPAYGNAVGGIVEAESDTDPPRGVHGDVLLNFVIAGGSVQAPVAGGWWLSASARRSYQDLAGERTDQYTVWPVFGDYALRAEKDLPNGSLGLFVWGAGDRYTRAIGELDVLDPVEAQRSPSLEYRRSFQVAGVRRSWEGGPSSGRLTTAVVHDRLLGRLSSGGAQDQRTLYATSRLDAEGALGEGLRWEAGHELRLEQAALEADDVGDAALRVAAEVPALARGVEVDAAGLRGRAAAYGALHMIAGPARLIPGLRASADSRAGEHLEPRAALRLRLAEQTQLKLAGGAYVQTPTSRDLLPYGEVRLPDTRSWQLAGGIEQTLAQRLEISLDGYRKWLFDPILLPIDGPPEVLPRGEAWGVELVTRYRLRGRFFLWGWLGWSRALLEEGGRRVPADGDQPFTGGLVLSWDPTERLNLGLRYRYGSGLPYTPIEDSLYDAGADRWLPVPGEENSARLPAYQKVDLHLGYTLPFKRWSLTLAAELWYVPPTSAALYPIWSYDYSEQGYVIGPTLLPLLGLRARF